MLIFCHYYIIVCLPDNDVKPCSLVDLSIFLHFQFFILFFPFFPHFLICAKKNCQNQYLHALTCTVHVLYMSVHVRKSTQFVQGTIIPKKKCRWLFSGTIIPKKCRWLFSVESSDHPIKKKFIISVFGLKISQFLIYLCSVGTYGIGTDGTFGTMVP